MAKCIYCQQKKGKRICKALNGDICTLCCGQHREKDIRCPSDCPFASIKQTYYIQKDEDVFLKHITDFFHKVYTKNREPGKNFLIFLDTKIYEQFFNKPNTTDNNVRSLLKALRARLSPVQLVIEYESVSTRSAWDQTKEFIDYISLNEEDAIKIVDSYINQIEDYIGDDKNSNKWIRQFKNLMETKNTGLCQNIKNNKPIDNNLIYSGKDSEGIDFTNEDKDKTKSKIIIPD